MKTSELKVEEVKELCQRMSYRSVARHYGMPWPTFQYWLKIKRKIGIFV